MSIKMVRREFLKQSAVFTAACATTAGCRALRSEPSQFPAYGKTLQDHLWMWGHDSGVYDGPNNPYNIPLSPPISMADAIQYMGIPNVCAIRRGKPTTEYLQQFNSVKRVSWALCMSKRKDSEYADFKRDVFNLRDTLPNLTGYYLDDFFRLHGRPASEKDSENVPAPAGLSMDELIQLRAELDAYPRRLELAVVLYTRELGPAIRPAMQYMDTVSLWIWDGNDIQKIEEKFKRYRELVPDKPTLLGIYMWNFGGQKELEMSFMVKQLDYALKLYKEGQINGMIFHCTPLCNKGIAAVEYTKNWIAKHGGEKR
ncbi:MAG: hypothetical protein WC383_07870 [Gammaproteobacteria bacterium]